MRWAKSESWLGEHLLTSSAIRPVDWDELGLDPASLDLLEYTPYGDEELLAHIAGPWGLGPEHVLLAASTTHAHFCFAASVLEPGDRVLAECPGYSCLVDSLSLLRVNVVPFGRTFESAHALPASELRALVAKHRPRLLLVTNLHNPSGVALGTDDRRLLVELCESTGIEVLSDEIYRPFLDPDPGPLCREHPGIVSVWGLNKVHGLPTIRVGWGLATPERVQRARCLLDATTVHNSTLSDQVARHAMGDPERLARRARRIADAGRAVLAPWLAARGIEGVAPAGGLVCFPRVPAPFSDDLDFRSALLEVGVGVTPGRFFGDPRHVRVSCGLDPDDMRAALARVDEALAARQ